MANFSRPGPSAYIHHYDDHLGSDTLRHQSPLATPGSEDALLTPSPQPTRPTSLRSVSIQSAKHEGYTPPLHYHASTRSDATEHGLGILRIPTAPPELHEQKTMEQRKVWSSKIDWYTPSAMVATFLLGVMAAVGHHFFYQSLDGKPARDQLLKVRYGTALAFFTKACLVGSVVIAYRQRLWHTVRHKVISIRGLDALFSIVEDPSWFVMSGELLTKAKMAAFMAAATWLIPIASVFSPGSLTAEVSEVTYLEKCNVPNIDFTLEATANWRKPRHLPGYDLLFYNTTPPPPANSVVDWYDQPSQVLKRLVTLSVFSQVGYADDSSAGAYVSNKKSNPCSGFNCTYTIEFEGPHYNCTEKTFAEAAAYFNESQFIPASPPLAQEGQNLVYYTTWEDASLDYNSPSDNYDKPVYTDQGYFNKEPKIWMGYVVNDTDSSPPEGANEDTRWNYTLTPKAYECVHQKAKYRVATNYTNDRVLRNITVWDGADLLPDGQGISPKPPAGSDLYPPVVPEYKIFAGYHAIGAIVRYEYLSGSLTQDNETQQSPVTHTQLTQTVLTDKNTSWPVPDLPQKFEEFYHNIVVSLLNEPNLEIAATQQVACTKKRYENLFRYHAQSLWIGYSIAIAVSFIFLCLGLLAVYRNGFTTDTTFSKILVTTRNKTLDRLVKSYEGVSLGGDPFPRELQNTKLRFGIVDDDDLNGDRRLKHTAFGLEREAKPFDRNDLKYEVLPTDVFHRDEIGDRGPWMPGRGMGAMTRM